MGFALAGEAWVPEENSQFQVEKWVPEENFLFELEEEGPSNGDRPWAIPPHYRVLKLDGTELMDTTDWAHVVGFLQTVLGEEEIPNDFSVDRSQLRPFEEIWRAELTTLRPAECSHNSHEE